MSAHYVEQNTYCVSIVVIFIATTLHGLQQGCCNGSVRSLHADRTAISVSIPDAAHEILKAVSRP